MVLQVEIEKCGICSKVIEEDRSLPCLHSFCKACLENFLQKEGTSKPQCPSCHSPFKLPEEGVEGLPQLYFTTNHLRYRTFNEIKSSNQITCELCEDETRKAAQFCSVCHQFLCASCQKIHSRSKISSSHTFLSIEEGCQIRKDGSRPTYCSQHPQYEINSFCNEDMQLICPQCAIDFHSGHNFSKLDVITKKNRDDIEAKLNELKKKQIPLEGTIENLKSLISDTESNSKECEKLVQVKMQELRDLITQREKALLGAISEVKQKKLKKIQGQKEELEAVHLAMVSSIQITETVLKKGTNAEIGFSKDQVNTRLDSLQTLTYSLEPVVDASLKFDYGKFPALSDHVKDFGSIVASELPLKNEVPAPETPRRSREIKKDSETAASQSPVTESPTRNSRVPESLVRNSPVPETPNYQSIESPASETPETNLDSSFLGTSAFMEMSKIAPPGSVFLDTLCEFEGRKYKISKVFVSSIPELIEEIQKKCKATITRVEYSYSGQLFVPLTHISELKEKSRLRVFS